MLSGAAGASTSLAAGGGVGPVPAELAGAPSICAKPKPATESALVAPRRLAGNPIVFICMHAPHERAWGPQYSL